MRKIYTVGIFIYATAVFACHDIYSQVNVGETITKFIAQQAKANDADTYPEARKELSGDLNHDGKRDIVVLYTLEGFGGGNNYAQYLAVFLSNGKTYRHAAYTVVGGKLNRSVELRSVVGSTINLNTKEYRRNDPACCPSRARTARFVFRRGKLTEIN
jgi:hypothetical protein